MKFRFGRGSREKRKIVAGADGDKTLVLRLLL